MLPLRKPLLVLAWLVVMLCAMLVSGVRNADSATLPPPAPVRHLSDAPRVDEVLYFEKIPTVLDVDYVEPLHIKVTTDGSVTSIKLALTNGTTVTLASQGGGVFSTTLTHAQALYGYTESDWWHNHVGTLRIYQGATQSSAPNLFINVRDTRIPDVPITYCSTFLCLWQKSPRVLNFAWPVLDQANPSVVTATQVTYLILDDDYDFLNIIWLPERFENRYHAGVRNSVSGIGLPIFDNGATYGSAAKLKGYSVFPISSNFDMASRAALHELGHQWINFLDMATLQNVTPHWPLSTLARGLMGWQCCGNAQGLDFPFTLSPAGGGNYTCTYTGNALAFNDMELYLMGFISSASVGSHTIINNQDQQCTNGGTVLGPVTTFTVQDAITQYGARSPSYITAQKKFRIATVVATHHTLLNPREFAFYDFMAARGGAVTPLMYSEGFVNNAPTWPFYLATGGRGCLVMTLDHDGGCYRSLLPAIRR